MHDKFGRALEEGDVVVGSNYTTGNKPAAMQIHRCVEGSETCNLLVVTFHPKEPIVTVTAKETVLAIKKNGDIVGPATGS